MPEGVEGYRTQNIAMDKKRDTYPVVSKRESGIGWMMDRPSWVREKMENGRMSVETVWERKWLRTHNRSRRPHWRPGYGWRPWVCSGTKLVRMWLSQAALECLEAKKPVTELIQDVQTSGEKLMLTNRLVISSAWDFIMSLNNLQTCRSSEIFPKLCWILIHLDQQGNLQGNWSL